MSVRSRKEVRQYKRYSKAKPVTTCQFCTVTTDKKEYAGETKHFWILNNIFPYSFWDSQDVKEHLLIAPKKHTDTISSFMTEESAEFMDLLKKYEASGYNIYARAPQSAIKTVEHQHTHLIKPGGKIRKFVLYVKKPHLRVIH